MNASRLSEEIKDAQVILQRLLQSIEEARKHSDPFGVFVFRERRQYRKVGDADNSKYARHTREYTESSFRRAISQGWRGDYHAWVHVLRASTPEVAPQSRT